MQETHQSAEPSCKKLRRPWRTFVMGSVVCSALFAPMLLPLARFAAHSELQSHLLLIPFVSAWLLREKRRAITTASAQPARGITALLLGAALILLALHVVSGAWQADPAGRFLFLAPAYVMSIGATFAFCFGAASLRVAWFPLLFLLFLTPLPEPVVEALERFLQHGSAATANLLFNLTGATFLREGLIFSLPHVSVQVAQECSGIHSTMVLFVVSFVAGQLLLNKWWTRTLLVLVVLPLGLARNAVRVVTLALLAEHVDRSVLDGPLHHHGGPLFFALSMGVFLALLLLLRWGETRGARRTAAQDQQRALGVTTQEVSSQKSDS